MDGPEMVTLPLPMATAFLCGLLAILIWRLELGVRRANVFFSAFFGLGAVASLLVGLRFGYGVEDLVPLQRTMPFFLGPLMYLGFASMSVEWRDVAKLLLLHLGAPFILLGFYLLFVSNLRSLDWVIIASYAYYSLALFMLWRRGPDALCFARVDVTRGLSNWLLRGIGFLILVLFVDATITLDFMLNRGANASWLISFGTVPLILLLLATLISLPLMFSRTRTIHSAALHAETEDIEITDRLGALIVERQLFLDSEITVQRLAKRLGLPSRRLSAAVNRTQGTNMSQYVNTFRLAHAAQLLAETDESVTEIAAKSGFLARSNFYREFQKTYEQSPTEYRANSKAKGEN